MSDDLLYKKSTMVLFSIEKSIGGLLLKEANILSPLLDSQKFDPLRSRIRGEISVEADSRVAQFLEVSYLKDLLEMLKALTKNTSKEEAASRIFNCTEILGIYDARNAIAHPVREFHLSYWYRIATLACDPALEELSIFEPRSELDAAEDGDLREIDENWWSRGERFLPNNLPGEFDHEATQLIGRDDDLKKFKEILSSQRYNYIAVVAPGGVGKTALVLEGLNSFIHDLSDVGKFKSVIYVTLKQEVLDLTGVRKIDSPKTIEALDEKINDAIALRGLGKEDPLILCIDNLDTLIVDDLSAFDHFIGKLPENWKIIVTTRIPIDDAKTLPLEGLDAGSSMILIRRYASSVGFKSLTNDLVERISASSASNPLAMRLNVDRVNIGGDVAATLKETQQDLVDFSFRGLVSALPKISRQILEVLFAVGTLERGDLLTYFEASQDDAIISLNKLLQTSVVRRIIGEDDEKIELTDSIRLLLQRSPLDLPFRQKATAQQSEVRRLNSQHSSIQESRSVDKNHPDYMGEWLPELLRSKLVDVVRFLRDNNPKNVDYSRVEKYCQSLENLPANNRDFSEYWFMLARLRSWQSDEISARSSFDNAVTLERASKVEDRIAARLGYVKYLKRIKMLPEAFSILTELSSHTSCKKVESSNLNYRLVWGMLVDLANKVCQDDEKLEILKRLEDETSDESGVFLEIQKSKVELYSASSLHKTEALRVLQIYTKATGRLRKSVEHELFGQGAYKLVLFLLREVGFFLKNLPVKLRGSDELENLFKELEMTFKVVNSLPFVHPRDRNPLRESLRSFVKYDVNFTNPFDTKFWREEAGLQVISVGELQKLERGGWVVCKVAGVGRGEIPGHIFCIDGQRARYFVGRNMLTSVDLVAWAKVEVNHTVAIRKIQEGPREGDYPSPLEIIFP